MSTIRRMNGGSRLVDFNVAPVSAWPPASAPAADETAWQDAPTEADPPRSGWIRVAAAVAALLALGWVAAMVALAWPALPTMPPLALAGFGAALCAPPALIGILWLLATRNSRAEAHRFGVTAARMRIEADALERRIASLSATLDSHRDTLAEQSRTLLATGDRAVEQLATIGSHLREEVSEVEQHARRLADSSTTTETSLGVLLASLPKAQAETSTMAGSLERTGLAASEQAAALDAQIVALAERGREADAVAGGAAQRLAAHITRMEATSETAGARLEAVISEMSGAVDQLLGRAAGAMDEARRGISAQGDAMLAMLEANQAALDRASRDSIEGLSQRIAATEAAIARIGDLLSQQHVSSDALFGSLGEGTVQVGQRLDALHDRGLDQTRALAASISALGESAGAMTEALRTGEHTARTAIGTTEELLTALDAAAREIDETMPAALARLDQRIAASKQVVAGAKPELLALVTAAESTYDAIESIARVVAEQKATLDQLSHTLLTTLEDGRARAGALDAVVDATIARTAAFSDTAAPQLVHALSKVREGAEAAAERARHTIAAVIPDAAAALERASAEAVQRAAGDALDRRIAGLHRAAEDALTASAHAAERLEQQLRAIADATAIIDTRIEDARDEREAAAQDGFARRVSLLVESLNSASIDIAKTCSQEVSDSAWTAYLKGDRGVFTRRAVRLLDPAEARDILRLYDDDAAFREHVNRYIHDFETMLRHILAQREGQHLGVTLLSSDMGKLYVALAQAIERLRT